MFSIKSVELREYRKQHQCKTIKMIDSNKLIIKISPPFPGHFYGSNTDLGQLIITPRYEGTSLVPRISEWPFYVNICLPEEGSDWHNGPYRIKDIGILEKLN